MLLLKIVYEEESIIVDELQKLRGYYKSKDISIGLLESIDGNTHFIKILCDDEKFTEQLKSSVRLRVSNILYKIIVNLFKEKELYEMLTDSYFFLRSDEIPRLSDEIMTGLNGKMDLKEDAAIYCLNKRNFIVGRIKECIDENDEINIEGFIRFRMKDLSFYFQEIVDKVVESYLVEKEYNEFIKLLKYFVEVQDSKIDELNIIIDESGDYHLEDKSRKDIMHEFMNEIIDSSMEGNVNIEDMIISGIITNAPKRIIIHGVNHCANKELVETIKNVFMEKVFFCSGCDRCCKSKIKL